MTLTHVTEWGLGRLAGTITLELKRKAGLQWRTRACDGADMRLDWPPDGVISDSNSHVEVPTCPRCAVLRDAALEGRLPERRP